MDKFILGENPMREKHDLFIIHLLNPIAIFQAHEGTVDVKNKIHHHYQFKNTDGIIEEWTLSVHHLFTTDFISEPSEQAKPLMDKAWRWYRSYLDWEDNNINTDEYASEN
jgi:hypothetical protein